METRDKWNIIHSYRKYAALGAVPEIKCPECQGTLVPVVDSDDDPALQCFDCRSVMHIGLHVYDQMTKNIKEFEEQVANRSNGRPVD